MRISRRSRKLLGLFLFISISVTNFFVIKQARKEPKYEICVCAIFKNEAPYLKEWIEFHRLQGVKHFYLYNNNSTDHYQEILSPYIKKKKVTLVDWSHTYQRAKSGEDAECWLTIQKGAYTHCLKKYGHKTKWLAAIDIDEFLFCPDGKLLPFFLKDFERYGGICVNWVLFGTSGIYDLPKDALLIENLTKCAPYSEQRNRQVKSIVQTKYTKSAKSAHLFNYKNGYFAVNALGDRVKNLLADRETHDYIRINHYWTRTEKNFIEQKIQSRHARREDDHEMALRERCKNYNKCTDLKIQQFVTPLKDKMFTNHVNQP